MGRSQEQHGEMRHNDPFRVTGSGAAGGITVSRAAAIGKVHYILDLEAFSDAASDIQILDGATVIWQTSIGAGARYSHSFRAVIRGTVGALVAIRVVSSTAKCFANIAGYSI